MSDPRILGVIPARLASTRLPRKVLRIVAGEPLLAWVYRAAKPLTRSRYNSFARSRVGLAC
jgi:CMP-2-keto-3-deoxyoctulosonic acid synthetase